MSSKPPSVSAWASACVIRRGQPVTQHRRGPGDLVEQRSRDIGRDDLARRRADEGRAQPIRALQPRPADDPQHAVRLDVQPPPRHVGRLDARPRLGQRHFRVTQPFGHRDRVAPLVAVQRGRAQQAVLRQPAGEDVAVGQVAPAIVEVGLERKALAGPETIAPRLADLHDGHRDLVALDDRPPGQVAAVEPRVAPALADDLDIGVAEPDRVGAHQDLIRRGARGRPARRLAVHAEVLDPGAEERPGEHGVGDAVEVVRHVCVS